MALSCTTWLLYGVRTAEVPQIPGNVLLVSGAVVVVLAVPSTVHVRARALGLAAAAAVLVTAAFLLPPASIGFVGFGIGLISGLPQIVASVRRRSAESAVSLLTWVLRVASQAAWLFYAVVVGDVVVSVSASFLLMSALIVVVTESTRRPAHVPAVEPALATAA
jgi:uncharacterized protein with PQ loop repeat